MPEKRELKHIDILLVEDNPAAARLIREMLKDSEDTEFIVTTAGSLHDAFDEIEKSRKAARFKVVLLDLNLPDSEGLETFLRLQREDLSLPIVLLTGHEGSQLATEALREGAQDFLYKGEVDSRLLVRSIHYSIERKSIQEALAWESRVCSSIAMLSTVLMSPMSLEKISELVLQHSKSLTESPYGFVGHINPQDGSLVSPTLTSDIWDQCVVEDKSAVFHGYKGLWGEVLKNKEPLMCNNPNGDPRSTGVPDGHIPITRFLSVPAMARGRLVGQIAMANSPRTYTEKDLSVLQSLASIYSMALTRKQMEQDLAEQKERLDITLRSIGEGVIAADLEGRVILLNKTAEEITGLSSGEASGRPVNSVFPLMAKTSDSEPLAPVMKMLDTGEVTRSESDAVFSDASGGQRIISYLATPVKDLAGSLHGAVLVFQDVTDKRRMEEELLKAEQLKILARSQEEWQATFDNITDLISIYDNEFNIIKANRAFLERYGLTAVGVLEKKCYEVIPSCSSSEEQTCPKLAVARGEETPVKELHDTENDRIYVISTFPYYSPEGALEGTIHISRDVTDERKKEVRLIMNERLAALGQMASGLAHEINNPLSSIAGCAEGLLTRIKKNNVDAELFVRYLGIIEEEIIRCKNITSSMLSFVRKTSFEEKHVVVNDTVDKALEIIGFQGRLKNIDVQRSYDEALPVVLVSEGDLRQVLIAIVTNALDAMGDTGSLKVGTSSEGKSIYIDIGDTGPGIEKDVVNRVFDPFFSTKGDTGGTGLGLSIAKRTMMHLNGDLTVLKNSPQGTTFRLTLPA